MRPKARKMMTLQSDSSAAMHCGGGDGCEHECAGLCADVQRGARIGWGGVYRGDDATLSIFGLPTRYLSIGSVR